MVSIQMHQQIPSWLLFSRRILTTSPWPRYAAVCNGPCPFLSATSMLAPFSSSILTILLLAVWNAMVCFYFYQQILYWLLFLVEFWLFQHDPNFLRNAVVSIHIYQQLPSSYLAGPMLLFKKPRGRPTAYEKMLWLHSNEANRRRGMYEHTVRRSGGESRWTSEGHWTFGEDPPNPYLLQIMYFFFKKLLVDGGWKALTKEMGNSFKLCAVVNILSSQGSKHLSQRPKIKQVGPQFQDADHHHPTTQEWYKDWVTGQFRQSLPPLRIPFFKNFFILWNQLETNEEH